MTTPRDSRPLRLLVVGPGDGRGGIASVIRLHVAALPSDRVKVSEVQSYAEGGALRKLAVFLRALVLVLLWLLRTRGPRVVHLHTSTHGSSRRKQAFALLARAFSVPYVLHLHGGEFREYYERDASAPERWANDVFFARAARVIVLSKRWEDYVTRTWPTAAVARIENAIRTDPTRSLPGRAGPLVCVFVGRLGPPKGIPQLVEVIRRLAAAGRSVRFVLAGDGDVEPTRRALAAEIAAGTASVPGWVDSAAVKELLASAHVLVLPSFAEGLPMSMLEGMAHGLVPVVTPVGGVPDVITDMENGLLVTPGSADELEAAIARLEADDELRRRLAAAAKRTVEQDFSLDVHLERLRDVYRTVLAGPHA